MNQIAVPLSRTEFGNVYKMLVGNVFRMYLYAQMRLTVNKVLLHKLCFLATPHSSIQHEMIVYGSVAANEIRVPTKTSG